MLGGGADNYWSCPDSNNFIKTIHQIGDTISYEFPGGNMSCSKMLKVTCGAPAIRVKPYSIYPEGYRIWFLEYDIEKLDSATAVFNMHTEYDQRHGESLQAGMARLD